MDEAEEWLFSELSYSKKHDARLKTEKVLKAARSRYFREPREENGRVAFRCKRRKRFAWRSLPRIYANICSEYQSLDIATLLTREGYRYYCDLNEPTYHHLAYALMALFHLGTVTRYSPDDTEELLEGEFRPVISELLELSSKQLTYQLISHMTESICVVPYAKF